MKGRVIIKRSFVLSLLLWTSIALVHAQNYSRDISEIKNSFKNNYHSCSIRYLYFPFDSLKKISDSISGNCYIDGDKWYYRLNTNTGAIEYLKNEKYFLEINHGGKFIFINKNSLSNTDLWSMEKIDSLLKLPNTKVLFKDKGGKGEYTLELQKGVWGKLRIVYDKKTYLLDEIWLYSALRGKFYGQACQKPKIGIFYGKYSNEIPPEGTFSENKYIMANKGSFDVGRTFRGYKLFDYVHKKT